MKTQTKDLFHGAALTQIVEHNSFKALNRASKKYGHYLVNTDRHLFVRYKKNKKSPWIFQFTSEDKDAINETKGPLTLCLICGTVSVCALSRGEIDQIIDLNATVTQSIRIEVPRHGSFHVSGSKGALKKTITHHSFPDKVFK